MLSPDLLGQVWEIVNGGQTGTPQHIGDTTGCGVDVVRKAFLVHVAAQVFCNQLCRRPRRSAPARSLSGPLRRPSPIRIPISIQIQSQPQSQSQSPHSCLPSGFPRQVREIVNGGQTSKTRTPCCPPTSRGKCANRHFSDRAFSCWSPTSRGKAQNCGFRSQG